MPIAYIHETGLPGDSDYYTTGYIATMAACVIVMTTALVALWYLCKNRSEPDCAIPSSVLHHPSLVQRNPLPAPLTGDSVLASAQWGGGGSRFLSDADVNQFVAGRMDVSNFFKNS